MSKTMAKSKTPRVDDLIGTVSGAGGDVGRLPKSGWLEQIFAEAAQEVLELEPPGVPTKLPYKYVDKLQDSFSKKCAVYRSLLNRLEENLGEMLEISESLYRVRPKEYYE